MKYLKSFNESTSDDIISQTLNDIFLDVSDQSNWRFSVDGDSISDLYDVDISFESSEPIRRFIDDDGDEHISYPEKTINEETIDAILRSIHYMNESGYKYKIFYCIKYSSDYSEDTIEEISLRTLKELKYLRENESIQIRFRKK